MTTDPLFYDRMQNIEAKCQKFQMYEQTGGKAHISKCHFVSHSLNDRQIHTLNHDV